MNRGMSTKFSNKISDKPNFSNNVSDPSDKPSLCQLISIFYTNCNDLRNKLDELRLIPETYKMLKLYVSQKQYLIIILKVLKLKSQTLHHSEKIE